MSTEKNVDYMVEMEDGTQVLIETYGQNLKSELKKNNTNVAELSRKTGVPATTLYSTISRNTAMSYEHAVRIARYLKIDVNQLTNHIPDENPEEIVFTVKRKNINKETELKIRDILKKIEKETDAQSQNRLLAYLEKITEMKDSKES